MQTIWKYTVPLEETFTLDMPHDALPLHVDVQGDAAQMWVLVDTAEPTERRTFHVVGTGQAVPEGTFYVGTFQWGAYVWHIWEQDATPGRA